MTRRVALTEAALQAALDAVRGAVLAAFPSGLPPWDPVRRGLEGAVQGQVKPLPCSPGICNKGGCTPHDISALSGCCMPGSGEASDHMSTHVAPHAHTHTHTYIHIHTHI